MTIGFISILVLQLKNIDGFTAQSLSCHESVQRKSKKVTRPNQYDNWSTLNSNSVCMSLSKIPGSFFNPVPENNENNNENSEESEGGGTVSPSNSDPFDQSLSEEIKKRTEKPLAFSPSTVDGKPTSKGFGKKSASSKTKSNSDQYVAIGTPDKERPRTSVNNMNDLQYDDQGYTLYENEDTGEKSRVFEALVKYPCKFKIKIVGANEGTFVSEMVALVAEYCNVPADTIDFSERRSGKWTSVTVMAPVKSAEMLYGLYESIDRDPRVKFKF